MHLILCRAVHTHMNSCSCVCSLPDLMNLLEDCNTPNANMAHTSSTSYNKMLKIIGLSDLRTLRDKVAKCDAAAVITDESTAIDASGKLPVGILLSTDGDLEICFVALRDLQGDATGENIFNCLIDTLLSECSMKPLEVMEKLVCFHHCEYPATCAFAHCKSYFHVAIKVQCLLWPAVFPWWRWRTCYCWQRQGRERASRARSATHPQHPLCCSSSSSRLCSAERQLCLPCYRAGTKAAVEFSPILRPQPQTVQVLEATGGQQQKRCIEGAPAACHSLAVRVRCGVHIICVCLILSFE
jgi:hypothetical protein